MEQGNIKSLYYVKLCYKLLLIFLICTFIVYTKGVLVPLAFGMLLALLLLPLVNFLESKKVPEVLAIALALLAFATFMGTIIYFLSTQIASFVDDIPRIKSKLDEHFLSFQGWVKNTMHISMSDQNEYINNATEKLKANGTGYLTNTVFSITEAVLLLVLLPLYTFLLLYYRDLIKRFLFAVFKRTNTDKVANVIQESKYMVKNYMLGVLMEMGIVAAANSIGLLILGIQYAVFFGVLAAVLNVIPYIGMFTATLLTVLVTMSTTTHTSVLVWIIVIMYGIHMIDVNIMMPKIVGSKVRINALISFLGVVVGGTLTGLSGLFLSVPAVALTKIICDQIEDLKPWGMLLGDDITATRKYRIYHKMSPARLKKKSLLTKKITGDQSISTTIE
ncbi:MAG: AI-2E family transporter [Ginsengibacter sp.]